MILRVARLLALISASAGAVPPATSLGVAADSATTPAAKQTFFELLKAYKAYPEFLKHLEKGAGTYDDVDPKVVGQLPEKVLRARINQFNKDFQSYRKLEQTTAQQLRVVSKRLENTPLSDLQNRGDLELKEKALRDRHRQIQKLVFLLSIDANTSILDALQTLPPEQRVAKSLKGEGAAAPPKLPGVFGGSRADRMKMSEADKINLTPIDDEFYNTQLGRKLQADLGGKADFWSYDFATDDLFVVVGNEVGKLRVKQDSPGIRYMQTRVGAKFEEPVGSDARVDMLNAKGRFLTGDAKEENLFGKMPPKGPALEPELPPGHSANDGHNHGAGGHDHNH